MDIRDILRRAYDPEQFRRQGHALIDQMADLLTEQASGEQPAIRYQTPEESYATWHKDSQQGPHPDPIPLLKQSLQRGVQLHNPNYMGHQISPPVPVTALAGLVNDWMNNGMGVYEMGQVGVSLERIVCQIVARQMGFADTADGFLTSGGTLANLTALLTARSIKASERVWQEGSKRQLALLVSDEAHYCVDRAVRIMGWGEAGIIKVPTNERYEIRTDLLEEYLQRAQKEGKEVIAVVGSACSTATGSFDDIEALADFCAQHDLWLHVDGAHGAATVFSEKYRSLVKGLERADSVAMDFHKMLLTPAIATALIYREGQHSYRTFAQRAAYLWESQDDAEWFNLAKRTFECTKAMYSLKFYSLYRTYGRELLDAHVTGVIDLTMAFAKKLEQHDHFEIPVAPRCNIICFRYRPDDRLETAELNQLNARIRQALLEDGHYYVVQTRLHDQVYLRCTLANPFTQLQHLGGLMEKIQHLARTAGQALTAHK